MTGIREIIDERKISEIVHFSSNKGLVGCLELGALVSRRQLPVEKHLSYIASPTAAVRVEDSAFFDKVTDWLDYVNLSISEINSSYFRFAEGWHDGTDRWWVIMSFDPIILEHPGVVFASTNNIYPLVVRSDGADGLNSIFREPIARKPGWNAYRRNRGSRLPTCQQAEVLYPSRLSLDYLRKVYVRTGDQHDIVCGYLSYYHRRDVEVVIDADKFRGESN